MGKKKASRRVLHITAWSAQYTRTFTSHLEKKTLISLDIYDLELPEVIKSHNVEISCVCVCFFLLSSNWQTYPRNTARNVSRVDQYVHYEIWPIRKTGKKQNPLSDKQAYLEVRFSTAL